MSYRLQLKQCLYVFCLIVCLSGLSSCFALNQAGPEYSPREVMRKIRDFFPEVRDPYISIEYGYYNAQKPSLLRVNQINFYLPTRTIKTQNWQDLRLQARSMMQALGPLQDHDCLNIDISHYDAEFVQSPEKLREIRIWLACG